MIKLDVKIPTPPIWIRNRSTICPEKSKTSLIDIVECPVMQTAEVAVNKESTQDICCPGLREKGIFRIIIPIRIKNAKLTGITHNWGA